MTKQLYLDNPLLQTFSARIISCAPHKDGYAVELDQTAMYPEGGGQPSDQGTLDNIPVTYVYKEDNRIFHVISQPLEIGAEVNGILDWERRKDLMQQHTGQHLLSASVYKLYRAATVGFHLTEDNLTIDLDKELSMEDMLAAEDLVNQWIHEGHTINCSFPDDETLEAMPLRKRPKVAHNIRIVEIDGADCTPCGGTHPSSTAFLGLLKIKRIDRYKGGIRVQFAAGVRALQDYREKNALVNALVASLKALPEEISEKVEKLQEDLKLAGKENKTLRSRLAELEADSIAAQAVSHPEGYRIIRQVFEDWDFGDVRQMAAKLCEEDDTIVLFGLKDSESSKLIYSRSKNLSAISMKDLFQPAIEGLDGKGGGSPLSAQGGGKHPEKLAEVIDATMDELLGV